MALDSNKPEVTITWATPFETSAWEAAASLDGIEAILRRAVGEGTEQSGSQDFPRRDRLRVGPVLPDPDDPRIATLAVQRVSDGDTPSVLRWKLDVEWAPSSSPPKAVVEQNELIGGAAGLRKFITKHALSADSVVGTYLIHFHVRALEWACVCLPRSIRTDIGEGPALSIGETGEVNEIGFKFDRGALGITGVHMMYNENAKVFGVNSSGRGPLNVATPSWAAYADEVDTFLRGAFFRKKEA